MRVHPSILAPKVAKWQLPLAFAVLVFLLGLNLFRGPRQQVIAAQAPVEKRIEVIVAKDLIQAGQPFDKANLGFEQRPVNTLPADAITSLDAIKAKVAAGPIPAGYPLSKSLIADAVPVIQVGDGAAGGADEEDPIETLLKEIEKETVAMQVDFSSTAPPRGTRVAITVRRKGAGAGQNGILLEDCWVSKSSGNSATIRVEPAKALLVDTTRSLGDLAFIEIPIEGTSPYAGKGAQSAEEIQEILGIEKRSRVTDSSKKENASRRVKNFAWVTGEETRYGIDSSGDIVLVGPDGQSLDVKLPDSFNR